MTGAAIVAEGARARGLSPLCFAVPRGSLTALVGPSGAGKTTLMRMVVGVQAGVSGTLTVLGEPAGSPALRRRVAYSTQASSVYDDLSVEQNLRYAARVYGTPKGRVGEVLDRVGLGDRARSVVRELSGGQRSRVSLAVALLPDPEVLVLDEPTTGLDPLLRRQLWALFGELASDGATLLISSHVLDEAEHCTNLLFMRDGALMQSTPADVKRATGAETIEDAFVELMER